MFTWLFYGAIAAAFAIALWKLFLVIVIIGGGVWAVIRLISWAVAHWFNKQEAQTQYRADLITRAEDQHQAILDGKAAKGHYGAYPSAVPAHCIDDLEDDERTQT